jgi:carbamoylphosphate synthase large subunit
MAVAGFVAPYLLETTTRFVEAAAGLPGTRLALITAEPADRLPPRLRESLAGHWRVDDPLDAGQIAGAVEGLSEQLGPVRRLLAVLEQLQVPVAMVREHLGIPGMDAATARNFRDKDQMKTVFDAAGVPCARHRLATTAAGAAGFAREVGFPLVVKPPAGAGAKATFRLDDRADLDAWLEAAPPAPDRPALIEEFLTGDEGSYDSVMIDGEIVWDSISDYLPTQLEVLRNPWMQWVVLLPRDVSGPGYAPIRTVAPAALRALGLRTGLTHMEWFRRPDGSVAVSEVGARPPGAQITSPGHTRIDMVECLWEPYMLLAARLREDLGLPGLTVAQTVPFRDKERMKQLLDAAGLRTPWHTQARTVADVRAAAERVGYPLIVKPVDGAGSADTYRAGSAAELDAILALEIARRFAADLRLHAA